MMYSERLVVCIKVDGKVLREEGDLVTLPFSSEYEIFLKNLHTVRASVKVSVDGTDLLDGHDLILGPNESTSLERFVRNGNLKSGNKLKFIERTAAVEAHKGIGTEDGLVRVEYRFEKVAPKIITQTITTTHHHHDRYFWPYPTYTLGGTPIGTTTTQTTTTGDLGINNDYTGSTVYAMNFAASTPSSPAGGEFTKSAFMRSTPSFCSTQADRKSIAEPMFQEQSLNDVGITVAGSESSQQFKMSSGFPTEAQSHVMVLRLRGKVAEKKVAKAITVDLKPTCTSCGKVNKVKSKFCGECGTGLVLI